MRIGIDARMFGLKHAGIGRYVENLILNLLEIDKKNDYTLFVRASDYESIKIALNETERNQALSITNRKQPKIVVAEARHYSLKEQIIIPYLLTKEKLDLVHFPHFNVPLLCPVKFVVTIHDLLWHEMRGPQVTTLSGSVYRLKYLGYKSVFANAVKKSEMIYVPSLWIKNKLLQSYSVDKNKIRVTHEGVDNKYNGKIENYPSSTQQKHITSRIQSLLTKYKIQKPYLIYTGSAYPHKNLDFLIDTMKIMNDNSSEKISLVIASARDVFQKRISEKIRQNNLEKYIRLLGFVPDDDLVLLYKNSLAFIFPSFSEGFGLPGLEAMACGTPVLAANNGALVEIYQNAALFFHYQNRQEIMEKIELIKNDFIRKQLIQKGYSLVKLYSFEKMASETLKGYQEVFDK